MKNIMQNIERAMGPSTEPLTDDRLPFDVARGYVVDQPIRGGEYRYQNVSLDEGGWRTIVHPTDPTARRGVVVDARDVRIGRWHS